MATATGIFLKYGSYSHAGGEASITIERQALLSEQGVPYGYTERWGILGMLTGTNAANVTTKINSLVLAYSQNNKDIGLYLATGTATSHILRNRDTISGTRVVQLPSFPEGKGAEYTSFRTYAIAVEGQVESKASILLASAETITKEGTGGPNWGYLVPLDGAIIAQEFSQKTVISVTQAGEAMGLGYFPTPNAPIWPQNEHEPSRQIVQVRPNFNSQTRRVTWRYVFFFESTPIGAPT